MILEGYSFSSDGKEYKLAVYKDFNELENSYQNDYTVYFLTDDRVFVLKGYVIAEGDLGGLSDVEPPMRISAYRRKRVKAERREASMEEVFSSVPEIEKIESMGFKNADTNKTVLELKVPTGDELDKYFSSIGLRLPEVG